MISEEISLGRIMICCKSNVLAKNCDRPAKMHDMLLFRVKFVDLLIHSTYYDILCLRQMTSFMENFHKAPNCSWLSAVTLEILNRHISAVGHPIHSMFGSRVRFRGYADRTGLLPAGPHPRRQLATTSSIFHSYRNHYICSRQCKPEISWLISNLSQHIPAVSRAFFCIALQ